MDTTAEELERLVHDAAAAFDTAARLNPSTYAAWLEAIAAALESSSDELVALAVEETHLAQGRLEGELVRTIFQLRLLGRDAAGGMHLDATIDHADPDWPMGARPDLRRVNQPIGVVGVFGASNFPFAFSVLGGDSASALAAGCAVIHKAHPGHIRLARRVAELAIAALADAGSPDGLFALVEGRAAAEALVDHPLVKAIGFTGSTAGGRALFDRAVRRPEPIPFYGELGSTNPVFVTPAAWAARRDAILEGFIGSVGLSMGQFCTKPGYLVVPDAEQEGLADVIASAAGGLGRHALLMPRLQEGFDEAVSDMAATPGMDRILTVPGEGDLPGITVLSTTASAVKNDPTILNRELFGPASVIVTYASDEEALSVARLIEGQLTTGVHGEDGDDVGELVATLRSRSGRVLWNGWPTGVTVSYAQQHGGPYPATTAAAVTSVGTAAIGRFMRPVAFQDFPESLLPESLRDENPWRIPRRVDGIFEPSPA